MTSIAEGFRDADGGQLFDDLVKCLDFLNELSFFRAYKEGTWRRLNIGEGSQILDVACGIGYDVMRMAIEHPTARIIGIDISDGFLEIARSRAKGLSNVSFLKGDGVDLPVADDAFDAARIDRSLQHMTDPERVLKEMVRATKRGGRIVVAEPDWATFILYNGDLGLGALLAREWCNAFRHPFIGRRLQAMLVDCGVRDIATCMHALVLTRFEDAAVVFDLERVVGACIEQNTITCEQGQQWKIDAIKCSSTGRFFSSLCIVEASGVVDK